MNKMFKIPFILFACIVSIQAFADQHFCEIVEDGAINRFKIVERGHTRALRGPEFLADPNVEEQQENGSTIIIESHDQREYSGLTSGQASQYMSHLVANNLCSRGSSDPKISCRIHFDSRETRFFIRYENNAGESLLEPVGVGVSSALEAYERGVENAQTRLNEVLDSGECQYLKTDPDVVCEIESDERATANVSGVIALLTIIQNPSNVRHISDNVQTIPAYSFNLVNRRTGERFPIMQDVVNYGRINSKVVTPFFLARICSEVTGITQTPICSIEHSSENTYNVYLNGSLYESAANVSHGQAQEAINRLTRRGICVQREESIDGHNEVIDSQQRQRRRVQSADDNSEYRDEVGQE